MKCPHCQWPLEKKVAPDITIDECPKCQGIYLDKGELNVLATGMAGDIEFCSVDDDEHKDKHAKRQCPACSDTDMRKVNLLEFSQLIFDYCPECEGFFLDRGEVEQMNAELAKLAGASVGKELREEIDGHLVTLERIFALDTGYVTKEALNLASGKKEKYPIPELVYLRLSLYSEKPLALGLYLYEERWTTKLAKLLRLTKQEDIQLGDVNFDKKFFIAGESEEQIKDFFTEERREALLKLASTKPLLLEKPTKIYLLDNRLVLTAGPYTGELPTDLKDSCADLISKMAETAKVLFS